MLKKFWAFLCIVLLTSCGGGGGGGGSSEPTPPPTPAASVNLTADPLSVLIGNQTTLTWSTSYASSCSASGGWSGSKPTAGTEDISIETLGDNQFTLTCSGAGGSGSASVTVEGYENTSGFVVDGYISGAEIFIDQNDNFFADEDEPISNSNDDGTFAIKNVTGNFVSVGGTDFDTQNPLDNLLLWHINTQELQNRAITPITSVASFLEQPADINNYLGLDQQVDVFTFDPVANKGDGGPNDHIYEKGNQLTVLALSLQGIVNDLNNSNDNSKDIFEVISNELIAAYSATNEIVNIETNEFITNVLDSLIEIKSLNIGGSEKKSIAKALSGILPMIQVKADNSITTAIFNFSTSTLLTDIKTIANGSASSELVAKYEEDLLSYVAEDQNLDERDLIPEVVANDDLYITEEDLPIAFNFLSNDSYVLNSEININLGIPTNGTFDGDNGSITYTPQDNYYGSEEIAYTIEQAGLSDSAIISITVNPVNDPPEILSSNYAIDENTTDVGNIRATDAENQELIYEIVEGDSDELNLVGNYLSFKQQTDYEEKNIYEFVADVSDGIDSTRKNLRINILDIDEPMVFISGDEFIVQENIVQIGTIQAEDPESREISYSLLGGDASKLSLNATSGLLEFKEAGNFEEKSTYTSEVIASDGLSEISQILNIQVTDVNEAPEFTMEEAFFIEENSEQSLVLEAIDEDQDVLTFNIDGADKQYFSLNSVSGELTLKEIPDYEQKQSYTLSATVSDGDLEDSVALLITINNVNETPEFISNNSIEITENSTEVGTIEVFDPEDDNLIFSLIGGDSAQMTISEEGKISLLEPADFESKSTYLTQVRVTDGEFAIIQNLIINVLDANDAPKFISNTQLNIDENTTELGSITATDQDQDPLTFSWSGADIDLFNISQISNGVSIGFKSPPNYEERNQYQLTLSVTDGIDLVDQIFQIIVNNVNEAPYAIDNFPSVFYISENENIKPESIIGTACTDNRYFICAGSINIGNGATQYQFVDEDGDVINFSLSGTDANYFSYTNNGSYLIKNFADYEDRTQYEIDLILSDNELATQVPLIVSVLDENEAPSITTSSFNLDENQNQVGRVLATDPEGDDLRFSIGTPRVGEGPDGGYFVIDEFTGQLSFKDPGDYEVKSTYILRVYAQDSGGVYSAPKDISVTLNNLDDTAPEITSDTSYFVDENQKDIGLVVASDVDSNVISFSTNDPDFSIGTSSGVLRFIDAPDYEIKSQYSPTITVSDGINSRDYSLVININNLNDNAPVLTGTCNRTEWTITENSKRLCLPLSGEDADGDSFTFSISGDDLEITDNLDFRFINAPDYESGIIKYEADLTVSDGELSTVYNMVVNVVDQDEPVYLTSPDTFTVDENQTAIGTVTVEDPDGDTATLQGIVSSSEDLAYISITTTENQGTLYFRENANYEEKGTYSIQVAGIDDGTFDQQIFTITVNLNDLNDAPAFASSPTFSVNEGEVEIGSIEASDEDGDVITYSISGNEISINSETGFMTLNAAPDYENKSSYDANVTISDGTVSVTQAITVNVTNSNDNAPIFTSDPAFTAEENQTVIGSVAATDLDGNPITYSITGNEITINRTSGAMNFVDAPDYETKSLYTATVTASDGIYSVSQDITITILDSGDEDNDSIPDSWERLYDLDPSNPDDASSDTDDDGLSALEEYNLGTEPFLRDSDRDGISDKYEADNNLNPIIPNYIITDVNQRYDLCSKGDLPFGSYTFNESLRLGHIAGCGNYFGEKLSQAGLTIEKSALATQLYGFYLSSDDIGCVVADSTPYCWEYSVNSYDFSLASSNPTSLYQSETGNIPPQVKKVMIMQGRANDQRDTHLCGIRNDGKFFCSNINTGNQFNYQLYDLVEKVKELNFYDVYAYSGSEYTSFCGLLTDRKTIKCFYQNGNSASYQDEGEWDEIVETRIRDDLTGLIEDFRFKNEYLCVLDSEGVKCWMPVYQVIPNIYHYEDYTNLNPEIVSVDNYFDFICWTTSTKLDCAYSRTRETVESRAHKQLARSNDLMTFSNASKIEMINDQKAYVIDEKGIHNFGRYNGSGSESWYDFSTPGDMNKGFFFADPDGDNIQSYEDKEPLNSAVGQNNNRPIFTSPAAISVPEGTIDVLTLTATDPDSDSLAYYRMNSWCTQAWSAPNDGELFSLSEDGKLEFKNPPDYENPEDISVNFGAKANDNVYEFCVRVTDNGSNDFARLAITVTNVNEGPNVYFPQFTSSPNFNADENQTAIGTVTATDADGDSISYSISGTDASSLTINSSSGVLAFNSAPDYETKSSFSATVTASDGTNRTDQQITITINDLNDNAPTFTSNASFSADENQTDIGTVTATDADTGTTISFSLSGTDASSLTINSSSGVLAFSSAPDYETKSSFSATVTASDGTNTTDQEVTITINNLNDNAPTFTSNASFSADENQTAVGTVTATDADDDNITYSISGTDASSLTINSSSGVLAFSSAPDYETKSSYSVTVTASDGENSDSQNLTVTINNLNDNAPTFTSNASFSADENQTAIGTVTATDADGDAISYSVSGTDASSLTINSSSGVLTFSSSSDYETKSSFSATVTASDGTNTTDQSITISVNDITEIQIVNDAKTAAEDNAVRVLVLANDTIIGTPILSASDGSNGAVTVQSDPTTIAEFGAATVTYTPNANWFGEDTFNYSVSAGGETATGTVTMTYTAVNDNPIINSSAFSADENQTAIGTLDVTDVDGDSLIYTITGTDANVISINNASGLLTFNSATDYETKNSYSFIAQANDGTFLAQKAIVVNIINLNDNTPTFTSNASFSADENQTTIGTVTATDADGDSISYSISGTDASSLTINSSSGVLAFSSAPDYETKSSFDATISATDGENVSSQNITISLNNLNDNTPTFTSSASFTADENQTAIGSVTASDADGDTISYSISGTDAAALSVDSSSGVLAFNSAPDHETKSSYSIIATASDGTNSSNQNILLTINDLNDSGPVFVVTQYSFDEVNSFSGNATCNTGRRIGILNATDDLGNTDESIEFQRLGGSASPDATDISVEKGSLQSDGDSTYVLCWNNGVVNYENPFDSDLDNVYKVLVKATNSYGTSQAVINTVVNNLDDESPECSNTSALGNKNLNENQDLSIDISEFMASCNDPDGFTSNANLQYSIPATTDDSGFFNLNSVAKTVTFTAKDFENSGREDSNRDNTYNGAVKVQDSSLSSTYSLNISIQNINDNLPKLQNFGNNKQRTVQENTSYFAVYVGDADLPGESTQSATFSGADVDKFSIAECQRDDNSAANYCYTTTGNIYSKSYAITPLAWDYENPTDANADGVYEISATVSSEGDSVSDDYQILIGNLNDNRPIFTATSITVNENSLNAGNIPVSDADGDDLTYSISGTDADVLTVNSSTGALTFSTAPDYETKSSYTITASVDDDTNDSQNPVQQNISIQIADVNEAPTFTNASNTTVNEGEYSVIDLNASDQDGNSLTFDVSGTDAQHFTINSSTGELSFQTAPDYENPKDANQDNVYEINYEVTDSLLTTSFSAQVNVADVSSSGNIKVNIRMPYGYHLDADLVDNGNAGSENNFSNTAQEITMPSKVVGTAENNDFYKVNLPEKNLIEIEDIDYDIAGQLVLGVYDASFTFLGNVTLTNGYGLATVNGSGIHYLHIYPNQSSNPRSYILRVGQQSSSSSVMSYDPLLTESSISNDLINVEIQRTNDMEMKSKFDDELSNFVAKYGDMSTQFKNENSSLISSIKIDHEKLPSQIKETIASQENNGLFVENEQKKFMQLYLALNYFETEYPNLSFSFNGLVNQMAFSRDPDFIHQWNLPEIGLDQALDLIGQDQKDIIVAVLDSGSPSTSSQAWTTGGFINGGADFTVNSGLSYDNDPTDPDASTGYRSHGTHVGSTIGALNDGNNINGFAVKVLPVRVLDDGVGGDRSIACGIYFALGNDACSSGFSFTNSDKVKVINMSLGGTIPLSALPLTNAAVAYAISQGVSVVAAAGNDADNTSFNSNLAFYPAAMSNVIGVGATTMESIRANYSNYGSYVDIAAPGGDTKRDYTGDGIPDGIYAYIKNGELSALEGTSMAAPHVSGTVALMRSQNSSLGPLDIINAIENLDMNDDIGSSGYDNNYGYGLLNSLKAIRNSASISGQTYGLLSDGAYDFGYNGTSKTISVTKQGSASLSITSAAFAKTGQGTSLSTNVDANGFGDYTISIDRSSLPQSEFNNQLEFTFSDGSKKEFVFYYGNLSSQARPTLKVYTQLYDANDNFVASANHVTISGQNDRTITSINEGEYYVIVSTDLDGDGFICDYGEFCAYYPSIDGIDKTFTHAGPQQTILPFITPTARSRQFGFTAQINKSIQKLGKGIPIEGDALNLN